MIIAAILFLATSYVVNSFLSTVFANAAAVYSILAIIIFIALALTLIPETRRWAWVGFIIAVILYVAVEVLAPYSNIITMCISGLVAIVGLILIKRPMLQFVRTNPTLPIWARVIISII